LPKIHSNIIFHSITSLLSGLFLSDFQTKILHEFLTYTMRASCTAYLVLFDLITIIKFGKAYKLWSSSLYSLLQPPTTLSLLGPNILLSTLFSDSLNLCSCLSKRIQVGRLIIKEVGMHGTCSIYRTDEIFIHSSSWKSLRKRSLGDLCLGGNKILKQILEK
jgi:hypothetical protein